MKRVPGDWLHNNVNVLNTTGLYVHLKMVKMVHFLLCIFSHNLKNLFYFIFLINLFYLFVFGCIGSLLLRADFL